MTKKLLVLMAECLRAADVADRDRAIREGDHAERLVRLQLGRQQQYSGQTADSPWIPAARVQTKPTDQSGIQKVNLSAEHQCGFWLS